MIQLLAVERIAFTLENLILFIEPILVEDSHEQKNYYFLYT